MENLKRYKAILLLFGALLLSSCDSSEEPLARVDIKVGYKEKHLSVAMSSNAGKNGLKPKLVGYYVYVTNGEDVRKSIETEGGNAWNFSGDYFKEVMVRNVSNSGSYQLFVTEGDTTVFNTSLIEGKEPTIYKNEL